MYLIGRHNHSRSVVRSGPAGGPCSGIARGTADDALTTSGFFFKALALQVLVQR